MVVVVVVVVVEGARWTPRTPELRLLLRNSLTKLKVWFFLLWLGFDTGFTVLCGRIC